MDNFTYYMNYDRAYSGAQVTLPFFVQGKERRRIAENIAAIAANTMEKNENKRLSTLRTIGECILKARAIYANEMRVRAQQERLKMIDEKLALLNRR